MAHMTNPLATVDQLYQRSASAALPSDLHDIIYFAAQTLTQAAGLLLRLPQSVTAHANVVLARYWLAESPLRFEFSVSFMTVTAIFCSSRADHAQLVRFRTPRLLPSTSSQN